MRWRAALLCLGSIWTLLGALYGLAPMHWLGLGLLAPSLLGLVWLCRDRLREDATVGVLGGLWGTVGYDLVRLPLHALGFNPFAPIRSYGMFLLGADHSTLATDIAGVLYHFSNGITFGILFALFGRGRHIGWAVLYAMILETFAIATVYGHIYQVRYVPEIWIIAYLSHLFYGLPLGWWTETERSRGPLAWGGAALGVVVVVVALVAIWPRLAPPASGVTVHEDAMVPGWRRVSPGPVPIHNRTAANVQVEVAGVTHTVPAGRSVQIRLRDPGIVQVLSGTRRSVFLAVEENGRLAAEGTW